MGEFVPNRKSRKRKSISVEADKKSKKQKLDNLKNSKLSKFEKMDVENDNPLQPSSSTNYDDKTSSTSPKSPSFARRQAEITNLLKKKNEIKNKLEVIQRRNALSTIATVREALRYEQRKRRKTIEFQEKMKCEKLEKKQQDRLRRDKQRKSGVTQNVTTKPVKVSTRMSTRHRGERRNTKKTSLAPPSSLSAVPPILGMDLSPSTSTSFENSNSTFNLISGKDSGVEEKKKSVLNFATIDVPHGPRKFDDLTAKTSWISSRNKRKYQKLAHWDFLLNEMSWLATDFHEEKKWKIALANATSATVAGALSFVTPEDEYENQTMMAVDVNVAKIPANHQVSSSSSTVKSPLGQGGKTSAKHRSRSISPSACATRMANRFASEIAIGRQRVLAGKMTDLVLSFWRKARENVQQGRKEIESGIDNKGDIVTTIAVEENLYSKFETRRGKKIESSESSKRINVNEIFVSEHSESAQLVHDAQQPIDELVPDDYYTFSLKEQEEKDEEETEQAIIISDEKNQNFIQQNESKNNWLDRISLLANRILQPILNSNQVSNSEISECKANLLHCRLNKIDSLILRWLNASSQNQIPVAISGRENLRSCILTIGHITNLVEKYYNWGPYLVIVGSDHEAMKWLYHFFHFSPALKVSAILIEDFQNKGKSYIESIAEESHVCIINVSLLTTEVGTVFHRATNWEFVSFDLSKINENENSEIFFKSSHLLSYIAVHAKHTLVLCDGNDKDDKQLSLMASLLLSRAFHGKTGGTISSVLSWLCGKILNVNASINLTSSDRVCVEKAISPFVLYASTSAFVKQNLPRLTFTTVNCSLLERQRYLIGKLCRKAGYQLVPGFKGDNEILNSRKNSRKNLKKNSKKKSKNDRLVIDEEKLMQLISNIQKISDHPSLYYHSNQIEESDSRNEISPKKSKNSNLSKPKASKATSKKSRKSKKKQNEGEDDEQKASKIPLLQLREKKLTSVPAVFSSPAIDMLSKRLSETIEISSIIHVHSPFVMDRQAVIHLHAARPTVIENSPMGKLHVPSSLQERSCKIIEIVDDGDDEEKSGKKRGKGKSPQKKSKGKGKKKSEKKSEKSSTSTDSLFENFKNKIPKSFLISALENVPGLLGSCSYDAVDRRKNIASYSDAMYEKMIQNVGLKENKMNTLGRTLFGSPFGMALPFGEGLGVASLSSQQRSLLELRRNQMNQIRTTVAGHVPEAARELLLAQDSTSGKSQSNFERNDFENFQRENQKNGFEKKSFFGDVPLYGTIVRESLAIIPRHGAMQMRNLIQRTHYARLNRSISREKLKMKENENFEKHNHPCASLIHGMSHLYTTLASVLHRSGGLFNLTQNRVIAESPELAISTGYELRVPFFLQNVNLNSKTMHQLRLARARQRSSLVKIISSGSWAAQSTKLLKALDIIKATHDKEKIIVAAWSSVLLDEVCLLLRQNYIPVFFQNGKFQKHLRFFESRRKQVMLCRLDECAANDFFPWIDVSTLILLDNEQNNWEDLQFFNTLRNPMQNLRIIQMQVGCHSEVKSPIKDKNDLKNAMEEAGGLSFDIIDRIQFGEKSERKTNFETVPKKHLKKTELRPRYRNSVIDYCSSIIADSIMSDSLRCGRKKSFESKWEKKLQLTLYNASVGNTGNSIFTSPRKQNTGSLALSPALAKLTGTNVVSSSSSSASPNVESSLLMDRGKSVLTPPPTPINFIGNCPSDTSHFFYNVESSNSGNNGDNSDSNGWQERMLMSCEEELFRLQGEKTDRLLGVYGPVDPLKFYENEMKTKVSKGTSTQSQLSSEVPKNEKQISKSSKKSK
eukprot:g5197.t1